MKKAEVVFTPLPALGHIVAAVETAKLIVERDNRVFMSVLVIKPTLDTSTSKHTQSLASATLPNGIRIIELPPLEPKSLDNDWLSYLIEGQKPNIKEYVYKIKIQSQLSPDSPRLAGFIFDVFCTGLKDVADEFAVPWYLFSASSAAFLGCMIHLHALHYEQKVNLTEFKNSNVELEIPSLANRFPARLLPSMVLDREWLPHFLAPVRTWSEARAVVVNTFVELESHAAINSLSKDRKIPSVYPVGPILKSKGNGNDMESVECKNYMDIMQWLDDQPPSSVVFLCFGSWGSFSVDQVKEIAYALERCGHRFLWSLRKPSSKVPNEAPSDHVNFEEILPERFLDTTVEIGKVIGWAPQIDVLSHQAIGGFVSHCGWNSILESVRFGIPIAAWPIYSEQQFNAFEMVAEQGLAVEMKIDYKRDFIEDNEIIVEADDIIKGIRRLMKHDSDIRTKVKEMSEISKKALMDGGSSYCSLNGLIAEMIDNVS
ncbi:unnamed protein product [Dovyalis caffra]|uniref:Glycosyltransferase n=1 Tax=Dovyalis caffra TaxID=77055 RepID=A0AAV1S2Y6_9ROSI|nr:unnamed protein product [Dovyalis caffra]